MSGSPDSSASAPASPASSIADVTPAWVVHLKLLVTVLFWGGTFVAGRVVSAHLPPFTSAFIRFAVAGACLLALVRHKEGGLPAPKKGQLIPVLLLGLTGVFAYNAFFFLGLQTVAAGRAAVIVATNPVIIGLLAALFFGEGLGWPKILGIGCSVTGAVTAITHGAPWDVLSGAVSAGDLAIVGCVASWVAYSLIGKKVMAHMSPLAAVTHSCVVGVVGLFAGSVAEGGLTTLASAPLEVWVATAYLGVCGTVVGFVWFYAGVKAIGASRAAVYINLVPVSAIVFGWLLLGEGIDWSLAVGAGLVLSGVYLVNRPRLS